MRRFVKCLQLNEVEVLLRNSTNDNNDVKISTPLVPCLSKNNNNNNETNIERTPVYRSATSLVIFGGLRTDPEGTRKLVRG